jgi:hypothetical protein
MTTEPMNGGTDRSGLTRTGFGGAEAASIICLLAGIWFFVSPWVYGSGNAESWNNGIVGALIFVVGCARVSRPAYSTALSWANAVFGVWTFFSPWIFPTRASRGGLSIAFA